MKTDAGGAWQIDGVACMQGAHGLRNFTTSLTLGGSKHMASLGGSITAVHFLKRSHLLATGSDLSGVVKLWDVRMLDQPLNTLPERLPPNCMPPQLNPVPIPSVMRAPRNQGVICIDEDPSGVLRKDFAGR
jgi:WD40 repeat protein